ncbi:ATP-binding protein [Parvibaculum sp.]|uniref:ATP-binding protein n=1 Tax=Parvibaculum sp. TaxID=2024848 RepID=UPI002631AB59|nr:ATP-binding protein [Parvibaculum sp.]MCW5726232.1 ATP-binding protein [Parvibaculum sp.]
MSRGRQTLGYVVEVDGPSVVVNLNDSVRSHVAGHLEGISSFEQPGDLIAIEAGSETLVAKTLSLSFAEPRELHSQKKIQALAKPPLRQLRCAVIGLLRRDAGSLAFLPQTTRLPALGAQALPLSADELRASLNDSSTDVENRIVVGTEARNASLQVGVRIDPLLSRHVAVLGATGQGKTHFVADILQQLAEKPRARIVIFDVNGEYYPAFKYLGEGVKYTAIGDVPGRNAPSKGASLLKIPYYALGRHGLFRLLLPSEKTQAPALRFATEHLPYVAADALGARPSGTSDNVLFDDCRPGDATAAYRAIRQIESRSVLGTTWPHMKALSCLVADSYAMKLDNRGVQVRDAFAYGHIQSLVNRVNTLINDPRFSAVVNVDGGAPVAGGGLNLNRESNRVVEQIFGTEKYTDGEPRVHVVDLSQLSQDLMPFVLGSLLELFAEALFKRGAGKTHPTVLVLEEAHHYLRQLPGDAESGQHALAYERLSKEGRKFGLSLLVSTQRPSELSPTVLAQCGTWVVFRLTNDVDKRAVTSASESSASSITNELPGLARGEAVAFGAAFQIPVRICRQLLPEDRQPDSLDPPFEEKWT